MLESFRTRGAVPQLLALAIIACALLLRVIVPQGWMPVQTAHGWRITICTGMGPMQTGMAPDMAADMAAAMKDAHHGSDEQNHGSSDHACAFSSLAMAFDGPPLPALDLPRPSAEDWLVGAAALVSIGRGLAAPPPPSTGPPKTL
ncbi:hypothetical protein [Sphingomonas abietis]|uniref:DUF2946 domain-containing protein n=1 Tax=Sphingomonas abietis TaxID=3012344 RepID=A0ABY7NQM4_9SPHN|nr:hypothetical protein [Sphingomonas abietis]WBO23270.1 hypothetical protein PBT88_03785 [Sphingomonas abietis]